MLNQNKLTRKVLGVLIFLSWISVNLDKSRVIVVQSLVLRIINYCVRIWATTNMILMNKVQNYNFFFTKYQWYGKKKINHVTPTLKEVQWIRIKDKHKLEICHATWYKKFFLLFMRWQIVWQDIKIVCMCQRLKPIWCQKLC